MKYRINLSLKENYRPGKKNPIELPIIEAVLVIEADSEQDAQNKCNRMFNPDMYIRSSIVSHLL